MNRDRGLDLLSCGMDGLAGAILRIGRSRGLERKGRGLERCMVGWFDDYVGL